MAYINRRPIKIIKSYLLEFRVLKLDILIKVYYSTADIFWFDSGIIVEHIYFVLFVYLL